MKFKLPLIVISFLFTLTSFSQLAYNANVSSDVYSVSQAGDVITFTLTVVNDSGDLLYEYEAVGDSFATTLQLQSGDINSNNLVDAGETWIYTATYTVTQADIDNNGLPTSNGFIYYNVAISNFYNGNYDTLNYAVEVAILGLDTDGDGVTDTQEETDGTDPDNGCDFMVTSITQMRSNEWFSGDCDGDGIINEMEGWNNQDTDGDTILDINDIDDDNDGIITSVEVENGDTDGDNFPNYLDQDSDNDGIPDNIEIQGTNDYITPSGADANGDGLDDAYDIGFSSNLFDTDADGVYDYIDIDSDNDTILDYIEGSDFNHNGVADIVFSGNDENLNGIDDAFEDVTIVGVPNYSDPNGIINNPITDLPDEDLDATNGGDVDYRDFSDNIPTCLTITNITVTNMVDDLASVDFIDLNSPEASFYEVEYGITGFTHGNGTIIYPSGLTATMSNLIIGTDYDIYVRAHCSSTDLSEWSDVVTFTKTMFCSTPIGDALQEFQAIDNPTITDLINRLTGSNLIVSNSSDCTVAPLSGTSPLIDGGVYYVYQDGCCNSLMITVSLISEVIVNNVPYDVSYIPFQIYQQPLANTVNLDDGFTGAIDLGFNFNYFGIDYSQVYLGTNSVISFDTADNGAFCPWTITGEELPNSSIIDNAILGTYQDFDNSNGIGTQGYGLIGTAPFRKFVFLFDEVSMYSCNDIHNTNQTILYESYNFIDVQIKDKITCTTWNNGNAIVGIQSIGGEYAYFPDDRNTGDWEAYNEGHRFKPASNLPDFQYIICDTDVDGIESFDLTPVYNHFDDGTGDGLTMYASLEDAQNNTNQISTPYTNTSNSQIIYCLISDNDTGATEIKTVLLATIDCNADYDLDTVATSLEDLNNNGNYGDDDTDGDQIPDFIDEDDDGDFVLTNVEALVTRNTQEFIDTDGDQIPNYLDNDDDGDGVLTINEDYDGDHNPANDDINNDGIFDYLQETVALGINNEMINNFTIYPNPVKENLIVKFNNLSSALTIQLYNLQGQQVLRQLEVSEITTIDVSSLSNGVYFVKVSDDNQSSTRKFIKK